MCGSATLTIVRSSTIMSCAVAITASTRPGRLGAWAVVAARAGRAAGPACGVPAGMDDLPLTGRPVRGYGLFSRSFQARGVTGPHTIGVVLVPDESMGSGVPPTGEDALSERCGL